MMFLSDSFPIIVIKVQFRNYNIIMTAINLGKISISFVFDFKYILSISAFLALEELKTWIKSKKRPFGTSNIITVAFHSIYSLGHQVNFTLIFLAVTLFSSLLNLKTFSSFNLFTNILFFKNRSSPKTHVLVCANSDAACDEIATQLIPLFKEHELMQLYAPSRDEKQVGATLKRYSNWNNCTRNYESAFEIPALSVAHSFTVIVCTLSTSSIFFSREWCSTPRCKPFFAYFYWWSRQHTQKHDNDCNCWWENTHAESKWIQL